MNGILDEIRTKTINSIPNLIAAVAFFIIGMIAIKILKRFLLRIANKINTTEAVKNFITNLVNISLIVSVSIISLSMLGVPVGTFAAIFGAIGVGLSIVFKESLANLGAGFLLIFVTKPFKVNDYISVSSVEGKVGGINLFSTALNTADNKTIMIPNSKLLNESIINYSNEQLRRIDINFYVEYGTDISTLKNTVIALFNSDDRIIKDETPVIGIRKFTPLGINVIIAPWVRAEDYWATYYDLMLSIKNSFEKSNIKITSTYDKRAGENKPKQAQYNKKK